MNNYFAASLLHLSRSFSLVPTVRLVSRLSRTKHSPFSRPVRPVRDRMLYPAVRRPPTRCKTNGLVTAATLRFKTGLIVGFPDEKRPRCSRRAYIAHCADTCALCPTTIRARIRALSFRRDGASAASRVERFNSFFPSNSFHIELDINGIERN